MAKAKIQSGYSPCACRDCFDVAMSRNVKKPELCADCKAAGCEKNSGECQRSDAYGMRDNPRKSKAKKGKRKAAKRTPVRRRKLNPKRSGGGAGKWAKVGAGGKILMIVSASSRAEAARACGCAASKLRRVTLS